MLTTEEILKLSKEAEEEEGYVEEKERTPQERERFQLFGCSLNFPRSWRHPSESYEEGNFCGF